MCGINGIITQKVSVNLEDEIQSMNKAIAHRGPDASGYLTYEGLALGHTRLSILDLSDSGNQPMSSDYDTHIVFNGEVYNYIEIRDELREMGYTFKTGTDTEVILAAYDAWQEECVQRFNGMWAFILLDRKKRKVFCSRDRFGVKPFYYTFQNEVFRISSEIKPLLPYLNVVKANRKALLNYLVLDICDEGEHTFFLDVLRLLPAHNLVIDLETGLNKVYRYYQVHAHPEHGGRNLEETTTRLGALMASSVELRMRSDVRVGSCLSGGLDSSFISSLAAEKSKLLGAPPFLAFTAKSSDSRNDESAYAKQVVENSGMDWVVLEASNNDFISEMNRVIHTQEEPFRSPSIFLQFGIMRDAAQKKCKVLLDGQGGDETFLGYERYYIAYLRGLPVHALPSAMRHIVQHSKLSWKSLLMMYAYMSFPNLRKIRLRARCNFIKKELLDSVSWEYLKELNEKDITKLQVNEISRFNLPALLRYEDKNSMRFAIETRLPFLDYRVVEFALSTPVAHKIHRGWTKYAIRKAANSMMPSTITWRTNKIGFEPPVSSWLSESEFFMKTIHQSNLLKELSTNIPTTIHDKNVLWKMYNIAKWEEIFSIK
jgi:asparagine synthase (glutamine-hydrolysing)